MKIYPEIICINVTIELCMLVYLLFKKASINYMYNSIKKVE